ncbi:MAG: hypothetical protein JW786_00240 [Desulfobacterales bacterium]|nr:hypothetical protein [Desulfobacterales bacterium]
MLIIDKITRFFFFLFLFAAIFLLIGCGKKAPPIAGNQSKLPAVNDLKSGIDGDILRLTWSVPSLKGKLSSKLSGYTIYRSKTALSAPDCKHCPILFKRVADIPIQLSHSDKVETDQMIYTETLEKGYKNIYKIILYTNSGVASSDSNYVDVVY